MSPQLTFQTNDSSEFKEEQSRIIQHLIQQLEKINMPIHQISEIIISDSYEQKFLELDGKGRTEVRKRGYFSVSKNFEDSDKKTFLILLNRKYTNFRNPESIKVLIGQVADINLPQIIPPEIQELPDTIEFNLQNDLKGILKAFATESFDYLYLNQLLFTVNDVEYRARDKNGMSLWEIEKALNREIKKAHFKYQADLDISALWISIVNNLSFYCNQSIYVSHKDTSSLYIDKLFSSMIEGIVLAIQKNDSIVSEIQTVICEYLSSQNIKLLPRDDGQIRLEIIEHPRTFYKEHKVIDTENRIVCFADILGFKNIVQEYEDNPNSTVLQDLEKALDSAYSISLQKFTNKVTLLDYKVFSDCLCISVPFINDEDFFAQLFILTQAVKVFQMQLMLQKFFIRGGIAVGSHYEDSNMIFSKALIDAYSLESEHAKNPRVLISDDIREKIKNYSCDKPTAYPWDESFVIDHKDNLAFINPFEIANFDKSINYMKNMMVDACSELQDEPLMQLLKSTTHSMLNATLDLVSSNCASEDILKPFTDIVEEKIREYENCAGVKSKYLWLQDFIGWFLSSNKNENYEFLIKRTATSQ